ncbi:MAG TPA: hypothetical protein P5200_13630 [Tenuifilaceae bacterium]|nr:hypothetical protein [Tenuifilaceae bacterium]
MKTLRNLLLVLSAAFAIASCANQQPKEEVKNEIDAIEVSVDSLLNDASALEGKTVKFVATVDHTCKHSGKRMTVFGTLEGKTMKVEGGEMVQKFDPALNGQKVEVIGVVTKVATEHAEGCENEEGEEKPAFVYSIDCLSYKAL